MATVLVIEDENAIRDLVTELLQSFNLHTVSAEHPDLIGDESGPFDLVLADLVDQRGLGFEPAAVSQFVQRLHTRFAAPVVLFTAHSPSVVGDPTALGAIGVIPKPFDVDDLAQRVTSYLEKPVYLR